MSSFTIAAIIFAPEPGIERVVQLVEVGADSLVILVFPNLGFG